MYDYRPYYPDTSEVDALIADLIPLTGVSGDISFTSDGAGVQFTVGGSLYEMNLDEDDSEVILQLTAV
jgi:hypothetical protein